MARKADDGNLDLGGMFDRARSTLRKLREQTERMRTEREILRAAERQLAAAESGAVEPRSFVEISTLSVVKATFAILGILALAWFLLQIQSILILFFIAGFLAVTLDPMIDWLQQRHIPRWLGILGMYVVLILVIGSVIAAFIPILTTEVPNLVNAVLTWLAGQGIDTSLIQTQINAFTQQLRGLQSDLSQENIQLGLDVFNTISSNALAIIKSIAGGVLSFALVLVITFFMVIEEDGIKRFLLALFPPRYHTYIASKAALVEDKFGAWFRGQLLLMLVIGLLTYVVLLVLGVNYAATLGMFAGVMELIPYVGPFFALIPAVVIAASQGGLLFMGSVIIAYLIIQQLENNVIVPLVMKRAVGLSPVVVMFAMLVGASFPNVINPVVGIILSVPVATAISVFVTEYARRQQ